MSVEIRRGTARFVERAAGQATWHAFSFGSFYDPANVAFGPMTCHDEHLLASGQGFPEHRHAGIVAVSWVVSGAVQHTDSLGHSHVLVPGEVGVLATGDGVAHAEVAAAPATRFVQVWINGSSGAPSYSVSSGSSGPVTVLGSRFSVLELADGESVTLPEGPLVHVYVATGALLRSSLAEPLAAGDAFLIRGETGLRVTAGVATQLLVWELADPGADGGVQTTESKSRETGH